MLTLFEKQKPIQGRPPQFLFGVTVTVLVTPLIADGIRTLLHYNLEVRARANAAALHVHQNAEQVAYFVGNFLQQLIAVGNAHHLAAVVLAMFSVPPWELAKPQSYLIYSSRLNYLHSTYWLLWAAGDMSKRLNSPN